MSEAPTRRELLACLDVLAAQTQADLSNYERLEREIAQCADGAMARLRELATLRSQVQAASATADDARPSPMRKHRASFRVRQVA